MNIFIVEPHFDDAWINLGGFMLLNPQHQFFILTLSDYPTNNTNGTNYLNFSFPNIKGEFLGYKSLGFNDPWMKEIEETYKGMDYGKMFLSINNLASCDPIKEKILGFYQDKDVVLWPMGLKHPQHIVMETLNPFKKYYMYREYPYFFYPDQKEIAEKMVNGKKKNVIDITKVLEKKIKIFNTTYPEQTFIMNLAINGVELSKVNDEIIWSIGEIDA